MAAPPALRVLRGRLGRAVPSEEPTESEIDTGFENALDYYMDHDPVVSKLSETVAAAVWRNAWRVKWGATLAMRYFENPRVRVVFRRKMVALRNALRGKKYVGIWFFRDMRRWMRDFEAAIEYTDGAAANGDILLPFGAIQPGMGRFVRVAPRGPQTLTRVLAFRPDNDDVARNYAFAVFDDGARFWPVSVATAVQGDSRAAQRELHDLTTLGGLFTGLGSGGAGLWCGTGGGGALRPVSAFTALYEMRMLIKEAQDYTMNAALAGAFPVSYATANAIPQDPLEDITDDNLAVASSLAEARTRDHRDSMKFTLPRAQTILTTLTRALSNAMGAGGGLAVPLDADAIDLNRQATRVNGLFAELAARYGRVNPMTLMRPVADFVTITPGREPRVDIDIQALQLAYEMAVCREMDVPHSFYRTEVETGRGGGVSNLDLSEKILVDTVRDEQALYARLFDWVYMVVFGPLDRAVVGTIVDDIKQLTDDEARRPAAQRAMEYMARMVSSDGSYARLEFELLTVRSATSLRALVEMQQLGLVDRLLVHRNAQNLFGHTLGVDPTRFATRADPLLGTNFNTPLQMPVNPETRARLQAAASAAAAEKPPKKRARLEKEVGASRRDDTDMSQQ